MAACGSGVATTALMLLAAVACGSEPAAPTEPSSTPCPVASAAKVGCRSPDAFGCATCCTQSGSGCSVKSATMGSSTYDASELRTDCPPGCPPCASCSLRDEQDRCALLASGQSCDCTLVDPGVDPCARQGPTCECYCARYVGLTRDCPPP